MTTNGDVYDMVTEKVISKLRDGVIPWRMEWNAAMGRPRNIRGRPYRGINVVLLHMIAMESGYSEHIWMTEKQAKRKKGTIRPGEVGAVVVLWRVVNKRVPNPLTGREEAKRIFMLRHYVVYNIDQVDGITIKKKPETTVPVLTSAEAVATRYSTCPPIKHGGGQASYSKWSDEIHMPLRNSFESPEAYYSTLFHEMVHSTGHEDRLKRDSLLNSHTDTAQRAKEELTAEMGSAFLCAMSDISPGVIDNQAAYIDNWLQVLQNDRRMIVFAASAAQRAADYIMNPTPETP